MSLVIILITYQRTEYALRTIDGVIKNLGYNGLISWYICDDGSNQNHYDTIVNHLKDNDQHICGHHSDKLGYGRGVNKAWRVASQTAPITLWLEDDWELREYMDITPHVELLNTNKALGMIRMGYIQHNARGRVTGYGHNMYIELDHKQNFAFAGHPHLKHDRFMLHYGDYPGGYNPGATELKHEEHIRTTRPGPAILWYFPCHWGMFAHIGTVMSYE